LRCLLWASPCVLVVSVVIVVAPNRLVFREQTENA
jgi:hypothetical protein